MSNFMLSPNADIYQLLAQQNQPRGGGLGSGGGVDVDPTANLNYQRGLMELGLEAARRSGQIGLEQESQRRMQDFAMAPIEQRQQLRLDQEAFMQGMKNQQRMFLEMQKLQLQLAAASGPEAESLYTQMQELDTQIRRQSNAMERAKSAMAEINPQMQNELADAKSGATTLVEAKRNKLLTLTGAGGDNLNSAIQGSLERQLRSPSSYGPASQSALGGLGTGVLRGLESIGEFFTGDRVADARLGAAGLQPDMQAAARMFGGGVLANMLPQGQIEDSAGANSFASNLLGEVAVDAFANSATGVRDRASASKALRELFNEFAAQSAVPNQDPKVVTSKVVPLLNVAAEAIYGNKDSAADLADALDEVLKSVGSRVPDYASQIDARGTVGPEQVQAAATAYALGKAKNFRDVLNGATMGQMPRIADIERMLGILSEDLKVGGAFQLPSFLREMDAQGLSAILPLLGGVSASVGRAAELGRRAQNITAEQARASEQMAAAEEALANLMAPSAPRQRRMREANLEMVDRLLSQMGP
jgi:hypothetical protein